MSEIVEGAAEDDARVVALEARAAMAAATAEVARAIEELAADRGLSTAQLGELATALSALRFGAQGGQLGTKTDYRYAADTHATNHAGERVDRPLGFADRNANGDGS